MSETKSFIEIPTTKAVLKKLSKTKQFRCAVAFNAVANSRGSK